MPHALPLVAQPDLPSQVNAVERDGYAYLPGMLDRDQVAELREHMERLEPLAESYDRVSDPEDGFLNRAINNAFNRHPHFVQFLDYPGVIDIAEAVLGADCHVIAMTSWLTGPGRPDQPLHADYQALTLPEDVMADRACAYRSTSPPPTSTWTTWTRRSARPASSPAAAGPAAGRETTRPGRGGRSRASSATRATW